MKGQEGPRICQAAYFPHPHTGVVSVGVRSRQTQKGRCSSAQETLARVPARLPRGPLKAGHDPSPTSNARALQGERGVESLRYPVRGQIPYEGVVSVAVEGLPPLCRVSQSK